MNGGGQDLKGGGEINPRFRIFHGFRTPPSGYRARKNSFHWFLPHFGRCFDFHKNWIPRENLGKFGLIFSLNLNRMSKFDNVCGSKIYDLCHVLIIGTLAKPGITDYRFWFLHFIKKRPKTDLLLIQNCVFKQLGNHAWLTYLSTKFDRFHFGNHITKDRIRFRSENRGKYSF